MSVQRIESVDFGENLVKISFLKSCYARVHLVLYGSKNISSIQCVQCSPKDEISFCFVPLTHSPRVHKTFHQCHSFVHWTEKTTRVPFSQILTLMVCHSDFLAVLAKAFLNWLTHGFMISKTSNLLKYVNPTKDINAFIQMFATFWKVDYIHTQSRSNFQRYRKAVALHIQDSEPQLVRTPFLQASECFCADF